MGDVHSPIMKGDIMTFEDLFMLMLIICMFLLSWNFALLDSRNYWRKKWEKELDNNVKSKN